MTNQTIPNKSTIAHRIHTGTDRIFCECLCVCLRRKCCSQDPLNIHWPFIYIICICVQVVLKICRSLFHLARRICASFRFVWAILVESVRCSVLVVRRARSKLPYHPSTPQLQPYLHFSIHAADQRSNSRLNYRYIVWISFPLHPLHANVFVYFVIDLETWTHEHPAMKWQTAYFKP